MQTWKLIGVGLLISVLVRGCPDTTEQSASTSDKQPLQAPNTQREFGLSSKPPSSLLNFPSVAPVPSLLPKGIQDSSSSPVDRNRPADSKKAQSTSSQIPVIPSVDREVLSRVIQQEPETNFDVSRVQANLPVGREGRQSLIDQGSDSDQRTKVSVSKLPNVETERSDITTSTNEENVASENQPFSNPVASSSSESSSGRCGYPWEFDSAGNRCGDRAASERPNLSTGNAVGGYSVPIRSYSIPTSSYGSTYVRGYVRRDGTYVRGHSRRSR